jgi:SAM-dependent methyltransferase
LANRHATHILETVRQYDTFLESIRTVADMGCGVGEDTHWWATLENYNDPPEPYNFNCFAVDRDSAKLSQVPTLKNVNKICGSYDKENLFPVNIDLMWAHDSLNYSTDPLKTLRMWNSYMTTNGMLLISIPQYNGVEYNRYYSRTHSGCYFNYTPTSLIYMLAVNGFDCRDAYLLKKFGDPWIQMAVYKSDVPVMDPDVTNWYELADKNLLHPSIVTSINTHGYLKQEEIVMPWLDKENYFIDYVSQWHPAPGTENLTPTVDGVFNETTQSTETTIKQRAAVTKETQLLKPLKIKSTPPPRKSYKSK